MTVHQARALQRAVAQQQNDRNRLISAPANNPDAIVASAEAYIASTDRCFEIACEIKGQSA